MIGPRLEQEWESDRPSELDDELQRVPCIVFTVQYFVGLGLTSTRVLSRNYTVLYRNVLYRVIYADRHTKLDTVRRSMLQRITKLATQEHRSGLAPKRYRARDDPNVLEWMQRGTLPVPAFPSAAQILFFSM